MSFSLNLQSYTIGKQIQRVYEPDPLQVEAFYQQNRNDAYWARIWPASIGLCEFLQHHPEYIEGKIVLELAAGLGLPGLYAARWTKSVTITDKEPMAAAIVRQSAEYLHLKNVNAATLDWNKLAEAPQHEVLLLSDVNYEPAVFKQLLEILKSALERKVVVVISTPHRLVAKAFITELLSYSRFQWNSNILMEQKETGVSVFVLEHRSE